MRTYTEAELNTQGFTLKDQNVKGPRFRQSTFDDRLFLCTCTHFYPIGGTSTISQFDLICAYEDCADCFGYGIAPIPWSELE